MSLVLEALKKLDREKGRDERGFVVMAAAPWPTPAARRGPAWVALGIATAGAVAAVLALRTTPAPAARPVAPAPAAVSEPTPMVVVTPLPSASLATTVVPRPVEPDQRETGVSTADTRGPASSRPAPPAEPAAAPPTAPAPAAPPAADPALRLQAISERDGQPIAIINDHLVRVGDEVDGMRVLAIRAAEVDVEVRGRRTTLRF